MATISAVTGATVGSVFVTLNLSNPSSDYSGFRVDVYDNTGLIRRITSGFSTGSMSASVGVYDLTPNKSYDFYGYATYTPAATEYPMTNNPVSAVAKGNPRPSNWSWITAKTSGGSFNLTASEWASFIQRINDFYYYKFNSGYPWSHNVGVSSGEQFTAGMFNEARSAISSMNPSTLPPNPVFSGQIVYAYLLNQLRDSLNSIS